jgi:phage-related protein
LETVEQHWANVREIRIHADNEFRVIYVASFAEAIDVLHAFQKKTRETTQHDLALATDHRYRELVKARKRTDYENQEIDECFQEFGV